MNQKKQFGQFFTTNSDYILQGFEDFIKGKIVFDPFAGGKDLLIWARKNSAKNVSGCDIDKNLCDEKEIFYNNSLENFAKNKQFICTNPPYLHKNKANFSQKKLFGNFEDLYQKSVFSIMNCEEGILIVPLNFLSAQNSKYIREIFFQKFEIVKMNLFTEQVFEDTTYNVIAFYFKKKINSEQNIFITKILPENKQIKITLKKKYRWQMGGEFLNEIEKSGNPLGVFRLTTQHLEKGTESLKIALQSLSDLREVKVNQIISKKLQKNILILRAIDSKNGKKIRLENIRKNHKFSALVGKNSSRNIAHLIFRKNISYKDQLFLMKGFNQKLDDAREKYFSLFLTNFRDNNRKRITFNFAYKLINHVYEKNNGKNLKLF